VSTSIGLTDTIAKQEWLKPAEEGLQKAVHQLFESGGATGIKVKDALHGTWIGHPLHVILTDIPLGAWTSAMLFDALAAVSGNEGLDNTADACVAAGLAGAIAAAATGLTDWQDVDPPARRIGLVHGLLNIAAASMMGASLVQRRRDSRSTGRGLGLLGFLLATTAARLGGNLVYEHRVGVDRAVEKPLPDDFTATIAEAELEQGKPKRVEINGTPIVLVRSGGEIYALAETCSHLGGPLGEGKVENGTIQCPWHGSRFSLKDGRVVNGPAVHSQPCLEVRRDAGKISVRKRPAGS
jgi:nitrite reductase/ring-hydroxylating ferredoxin subunit/uncharacterized membrane protein